MVHIVPYESATDLATRFLCAHHMDLARLNPTATPVTLFEFLDIKADRYPFESTSSDFPGSIAYAKARSLINKYGMIKAIELWRAYGDETTKGDMAIVTTSILLSDELRAVYLRDLLPKLIKGRNRRTGRTRWKILKEVCKENF